MLNNMADDQELFLYGLLIIDLLRLRRRRKERARARRPKRFWIREIYRRRQAQGVFNNLVRELRVSDRDLYFRYVRIA